MPKRIIISQDEQNRITAAMRIMKSKEWDINEELKAHDVHDMLSKGNTGYNNEIKKLNIDDDARLWNVMTRQLETSNLDSDGVIWTILSTKTAVRGIKFNVMKRISNAQSANTIQSCCKRHRIARLKNRSAPVGDPHLELLTSLERIESSKLIFKDNDNEDDVYCSGVFGEFDINIWKSAPGTDCVNPVYHFGIKHCLSVNQRVGTRQQALCSNCSTLDEYVNRVRQARARRQTIAATIQRRKNTQKADPKLCNRALVTYAHKVKNNKEDPYLDEHRKFMVDWMHTALTNAPEIVGSVIARHINEESTLSIPSIPRSVIEGYVDGDGHIRTNDDDEEEAQVYNDDAEVEKEEEIVAEEEEEEGVPEEEEGSMSDPGRNVPD